jgi:hypothetical protein
VRRIEMGLGRTLLTRLLRRYNYDLFKIYPNYPITNPVKGKGVEILADKQFQQSVEETKDLTLLDTARLANLWSLCRMTDAAGAILEVGTYRGGSALHLSNSDPRRKIIVCEPFSPESFEELDSGLDRTFSKGQFAGVSPASVEDLFRHRERDYEVVVGYFPESLKGKALPGVSFVHLDVDVYEATCKSLEFLLSSSVLLPKSFIVLDDYRRDAQGIDRAVEEVVGRTPGWLAVPLFPAQALLIPSTWFFEGEANWPPPDDVSMMTLNPILFQ